jgi:hypothetical protein
MKFFERWAYENPKSAIVALTCWAFMMAALVMMLVEDCGRGH